MRNVESHLLEDEAVTHYINSHQSPESVHVDANSLALNVQEDAGGRVVTVMHPQNFSSQMCRQISVSDQVGEGPWVEELLDPEGRLAAIMAHLAQHSRGSHHQSHLHHKAHSVRSDVDNSVILDTPMRLYNGQPMDQQSETIVVQVPTLTPLPPLQDMKRCPETDWFNKDKNTLKDNTQMLSEQDNQVLDIANASPANKQQSKKSLPHKKRISRKLKRTNGSSTPQQDIVVINCGQEPPQEEILPDSFVGVPADALPPPLPDTHIPHDMRALFICQLCGEFYGEEQLKFYQHLKQHYEPHATIIIENPVPDLGIDKMTNTCIVDNVPTLPDSIVELSLEGSVPKTMYQSMDKHILYTTSDKTLYTNKVQYSVASMDKEPESEKALYDSLDKLDYNMERYSCTKCNKSFRKQKQCEAHYKEAHTNSKLEDMSEFSEPEDLMEGIHVAVDESGEQYEQTLLPHLTVENGHVHQEHVRHWYMRASTGGASPPLCACGGAGYCALCAQPPPPLPSPLPPAAPSPPRPALPSPLPPPLAPTLPVSLTCVATQVTTPIAHAQVTSERSPGSKEELQPIFEPDEPQETFQENQNQVPENQSSVVQSSVQIKDEPPSDPKYPKKKTFECTHCGRVFHHRNSLLYHTLMHSEKQQVCKECGKSFYTVNALKIHKRVHNGDRPCKCDECGREFRQWSDLKYHKASLHSDKKHFKCEFCGKEFARRYSLNLHRKIHTGEKNYKCEYCNKSFRASSYRLSHMRTHTDDRPHKCPQCDKRFRVAYDLQRHIMNIHEKARIKAEEQKKAKELKEKKTIEIKPEEKIDMKNPKSVEKKAEKVPILKSLLDRKHVMPLKKSPKKAPNVTVQNRSDGLNEEIFDTRQDQYKFKEVYTQKDYPEMTSLRIAKNHQVTEEKVYTRENTDGKLQVFTQIEKNKEYSGPIVTNVVSLSDIKNLEREVGREPRNEIHPEGLENSFFERLSAFYNIPAV